MSRFEALVSDELGLLDGGLQDGGGAGDVELVAAVGTEGQQLVAVGHGDFAPGELLGVVQLLDAATETDDQVAGIERFAATIAVGVRDIADCHANSIALEVGQNPSDRDYMEGRRL